MYNAFCFFKNHKHKWERTIQHTQHHQKWLSYCMPKWIGNKRRGILDRHLLLLFLEAEYGDWPMNENEEEWMIPMSCLPDYGHGLWLLWRLPIRICGSTHQFDCFLRDTYKEWLDFHNEIPGLTNEMERQITKVFLDRIRGRTGERREENTRIIRCRAWGQLHRFLGHGVIEGVVGGDIEQGREEEGGTELVGLFTVLFGYQLVW